MDDNQRITHYDEAKISSHSIYKKNKNLIKEMGMADFLEDNGIFIVITPITLPYENFGKIIGVTYRMQYRTYLKDNDKWNMIQNDSHIRYKDEIEASTAAILVSFDLIERGVYKKL
jgi:hypothetical protein